MRDGEQDRWEQEGISERGEESMEKWKCSRGIQEKVAAVFSLIGLWQNANYSHHNPEVRCILIP